MAGLSTAGAAGADDFTDRRHGEGRAIANNTFREFHGDMVNKYGDVALEGIEMFVSKTDREAVSALKICHSAYRSVAGMWEF